MAPPPPTRRGIGAAVAAGAGATVGLAEATGGDAAGRAAATTGFFFFAIGFFGGVSLLGWTASWQGGPLSRENLRGGETTPVVSWLTFTLALTSSTAASSALVSILLGTSPEVAALDDGAALIGKFKQFLNSAGRLYAKNGLVIEQDRSGEDRGGYEECRFDAISARANFGSVDDGACKVLTERGKVGGASRCASSDGVATGRLDEPARFRQHTGPALHRPIS